MCLSARPARFSKTIVYAADTTFEKKYVDVLGYQNTAESQEDGPNAMLLPIPSAAGMGPENFVDTTSCPRVLRDMVDAIRVRHDSDGFGRRSRSMSLGMAKSVQVFDSGMYTVVLAEDATAIPKALRRVPEKKRPQVSEEILAAYKRWYPDWPVALFCFEGTIKADPVLVWYEPKDPDHLFLPALDGHDGHAPNLASRVRVDHTLICGHVRGKMKHFDEVSYTQALSEKNEPFISKKVVGLELATLMNNGDFYANVEALGRNEDLGAMRMPPPGAKPEDFALSAVAGADDDRPRLDALRSKLGLRPRS